MLTSTRDDLLYIDGKCSVDNLLYYSALGLAESGYPVFPLHSAENGVCSCHLGRDCHKTAKHPRTNHGLTDATTNQRRIEGWWSKWPDANIGLRTGDGLVVVDIDGPEGEQQAALLELPRTVEASTGNGRHLYYQGTSKSRTRILPGIDIRGTGGYVIAPPSVHATGTGYQWINSLGDCDLAPLPEWVTEQPLANKSTSTRPSGPIERRPIVEGERNQELFRYACLLRSIGCHRDEIAAAIDARNSDCCQPPLEIEEIVGIAYSAAQNPGIHLSDSALLDQGLHPYTLAIYLAIRARANHQGVCMAGYDALADDALVGATRVKSKAIPELEAVGLLSVERPGPLRSDRVRRSNIYTLLDPREQSTAPAPAEGTTTQGEDDHDGR